LRGFSRILLPSWWGKPQDFEVAAPNWSVCEAQNLYEIDDSKDLEDSALSLQLVAMVRAFPWKFENAESHILLALVLSVEKLSSVAPDL
jgi:hypothetical protein